MEACLDLGGTHSSPCNFTAILPAAAYVYQLRVSLRPLISRRFALKSETAGVANKAIPEREIDIYIYIHTYIHIYIYIEREGVREVGKAREKKDKERDRHLYIHIYVCVGV